MSTFPLTAGLAALQFALAICWLAYALSLPPILASVGLPRSVTPWILCADQVLFCVLDLVLSMKMSSALRVRERVMPLLIPAVLCSAFAMILLPAVTGLGKVGVLSVLLIWVVSTAALRAPVLLLYERHVPPERFPGGLGAALVGVALAAALAPFVAELLRSHPAVLGLGLSSVLLVLMVLALTLAERQAPPSPAPPLPGPWTLMAALKVPILAAGTLTLALGSQIFSVVKVGPVLAASVNAAFVQWVLVAAGVAAAVAALVAGLACGRVPGPLIASLGALGLTLGIGLASAGQAGSIVAAGVVLASASGAVAGVGAIQAAAMAGAPARQGLTLGVWSAMGSLAVALRLGLVSTGATGHVSGLWMDLGTVGLLGVAGVFFLGLLITPESEAG